MSSNVIVENAYDIAWKLAGEIVHRDFVVGLTYQELERLIKLRKIGPDDFDDYTIEPQKMH